MTPSQNPGVRAVAPNCEVRLGRWQDVLRGVHCGAWISDPPYGARTHAASTTRSDGSPEAGLTPEYAALTTDDVHELVASWSPRVWGWMVALTDHTLIDAYTRAYEAAGRYAFAPVPCVTFGGSVRLQGDGPSSWTIYAMVARPRTREAASWGTLPGAYRGGSERDSVNGSTERGGGRGKPQWMMQALVRDYSCPGDLICDPFAGWGSTGTAALSLGRSFIGSECDAAAHAECVRRLGRPVQLDMLEAVSGG